MMSAFGTEGHFAAEIQCPLLTQSGHSLFYKKGRKTLGLQRLRDVKSEPSYDARKCRTGDPTQTLAPQETIRRTLAHSQCSQSLAAREQFLALRICGISDKGSHRCTWRTGS